MSSRPKRFKKDAKPIDSGNFMISNTQLYDDDTVISFFYLMIEIIIFSYYYLN